MEPAMSDVYLFVYGTLRENKQSDMFQLLIAHSSFYAKASFQGKMYRIAHYPGVIPSDNPDDLVIGDVYALANPDAILPKLDHYEGIGPEYEEPYEYERCEVRVKLENGELLECWMYLYRAEVEDVFQIESGDFSKG